MQISDNMPRTKLFDENEVLTKAMNLFWKNGYSATSIKDLVTELGINRASIYDTFGDKESLFLKAFDKYRTLSSEGLSAFLDQEEDIKSGLTKLFERAYFQSINDVEKKGCFAVNTTTELVPGDAEMLRILERNRLHLEAIFLNYLKIGEDKGQIRKGKDLVGISKLLFTFYNGLQVVSKISSDKDEVTSSVKHIISLLD